MLTRRKQQTAPEVVYDPVTVEAEQEPLAIEPVPSVAVMERAKAAITDVTCEIDMAGIRTNLRLLQHRKDKLFGIEEGARKQLERAIFDLDTQKHEYNAHKRLSAFGTPKCIDPEVLRWRKREPCIVQGVAIPVPELALFSLDSPTTSIWWDYHGNIGPGIPYGFAAHYEDVFSALERVSTAKTQGQLAFGHYMEKITAEFTGVIPDRTRERILEAHKHKVFDGICLLAEAEWEQQSVLVDPIVVGCSAGKLWVVDIFDPTPIEEYVAQEFTV